MTTLPNLQKGITKDATPPLTDTIVSPISIPNGTILITTKLHNEIVDNLDQLIDYVSGDNGPNFIPQSAIADLLTDLAGKEPTLGFTPENIANKGVGNGYGGLDTGQIWLGNNGFQGGINVLDAAFEIRHINDFGKMIKFSASQISSGQTRTITIPNESTTMAGLSVAIQNWTGIHNFLNDISVEDNKFNIQNTSDSSKRIKFSASEISPSQIRTITIPDESLVMAGIDVSFQNWTGVNDFVNLISVVDTKFSITDEVDVTKNALFDVSLITPGQSSIITIPDASGTILITPMVQTLDANGNNIILNGGLIQFSDVNTTISQVGMNLEFNSIASAEYVFNIDSSPQFTVTDTIVNIHGSILQIETGRIQFNDVDTKILEFGTTLQYDVALGEKHDFRTGNFPRFSIRDSGADGEGNRIKNVGDPINNQDVVTLAYGDANYLTASSAALNDLSDVDTTGEATGSTLFKSAGDWIVLIAGSTGQVLTIAAGIPSWTTPIVGEFFGPWTNTHDAAGKQLSNLGSLTSNSVNPATLGLVRLGVSDTIEWRNVGNNDNNQISFSGNAFQILPDGVLKFSFNAFTFDMKGNELKDVSFIIDSNDNLQLDFVKVTNAVNHIRITNSITGEGALISTGGDDNNVDLILKTKGAGFLWLQETAIKLGDLGDEVQLVFQTQTANVPKLVIPNIGDTLDIFTFNDTTQTLQNKTLLSPVIDEIVDPAGKSLLRFEEVFSAVNFIAISNNITGVAPIVSAQGIDDDIDLELRPKGLGTLVILSDKIIVGSTNALDIVVNQAVAAEIGIPPITGTSDNFVTELTTQSLSNKTLITPVIDKIIDANGNTLLDFGVVGNAANFIKITNTLAGSDPVISVDGPDSNIGIEILPKGQAGIYLNTDIINMGSSVVVGLGFFDAQSANVQILLRELDGVDDFLVLEILEQTLFNKTFDNPIIENNIILNTGAGTKLGTATNQKLGFWDTTPIIQPTHIVDANGALADITTKFNALLAQLASMGLQASA